MGESERREPFGRAIEDSRPVEGTDLHEVKVEIGAVGPFLAIVGALRGDGECGLILHSQPACDLHIIRGRELLDVHSASAEMALPILQALTKEAIRRFNPYPHANLSQKEQQIVQHLKAAEGSMAAAVERSYD